MFLGYDYQFLVELADFLDGHLGTLYGEADESTDPDQLGVLDRIDHVCGLGFVACQNYLEASANSHGISKADAFQQPPIHVESGRSVASLANGAANFWKHRSNDPRTGAFEALGLDFHDPYPLMSSLSRLVAPNPPLFGSLVPVLGEWSRGLRDNPGGG